MPELTKKSLPPVFAAMAALDEAVAAHDVLVEGLADAVAQGTRLDEQLRRIDPANQEKLVGAAQLMADAVALVQSIARREERARVVMHRAQSALAETRRAENQARLEELRIELEIDAASIWDLVGQFEAQVRARIEEHGKLAAELHFVASAVGEPGETAQAPAAAMLMPALGTSGPELWSALAGGVRQLHDRHGAPVPGSAAARPGFAAPERFDFARPVAIAERDDPAASAILAHDAARFDVSPPEAIMEKNDPPASAIPVQAEARFDFARPAEIAAKTDPPALTIPVHAAARAPAARAPASSVRGPPSPVEPEEKRGRLDRMLRNLARMVGSKPARRTGR